jgi:hypothetical protein
MKMFLLLGTIHAIICMWLVSLRGNKKNMLQIPVSSQKIILIIVSSTDNDFNNIVAWDLLVHMNDRKY